MSRESDVIVHCPNCKQEISVSADTCRYCGFSLSNYRAMLLKREEEKRNNREEYSGREEKTPSVGSIIRRIFVTIISIILVFVAIGCFSDLFHTGRKSSSGSSTTSDSSRQNVVQAINNTVSDYRLEVVTEPHLVKQEYGNIVIEGKLKNVSGRTLSYAEIMFALYDKDGAQIGSAVANINNLTDGSVWKYTATPLTTEKWTDFKQTEVESW